MVIKDKMVKQHFQFSQYVRAQSTDYFFLKKVKSVSDRLSGLLDFVLCPYFILF
jgi:hypothetical protein